MIVYCPFGAAYYVLTWERLLPQHALAFSESPTQALTSFSAYCKILTLCTCPQVTLYDFNIDTSTFAITKDSSQLTTTRLDNDDYCCHTIIYCKKIHSKQSHVYCSSKKCFNHFQMCICQRLNHSCLLRLLLLLHHRVANSPQTLSERSDVAKPFAKQWDYVKFYVGKIACLFLARLLLMTTKEEESVRGYNRLLTPIASNCRSRRRVQSNCRMNLIKIQKLVLHLVNNLWWNIVMDDCNLDENPLEKWE